ncbi:MAG: CaiB/BaiF CoA transferase family protein [Pseudomonadota bacterium]
MSQALPLQGITVIELGSSLAAPYAALILAEMGAEVIKVEHPEGGDAARTWGPNGDYGFSLLFETFNRNKKSVTVNFTDQGELDRLRQLILARADVVLQNLRPGVVEDLKLDGPSLLAQKPALIYCNLGAFGGTGEMSRLPGYDPLMQAFTGMCDVTGPEGGEQCRVGVPVVDMGTGMWAAMGILTKLLARKEDGKGGQVDVALYETAMTWMSMPMASVMATGKSPGRYGLRGPGGLAPNRGYQASDGVMIITAGTNYQFRKLCAALGHPEWAQDERFTTPRGRSKYETEMSALIGDVIRTQTRAHWMRVLDEVGVPNAPVHTPVEAFNHPQTQASGLIQGSADGSSPQVALPLKFDRARLPYRHRAPKLGEHNDLLKA